MCTTSGIKRLGSLSRLGLLTLAVIFAWPAFHAYGEERKFIVMPAYMRKPGGALPRPNVMNEIDPAFFDHSNNNIDSFAEYWEEISYGNVTIDGTTFSWAELPWPAAYTDGNVIPYVNLNTCPKCQVFTGEAYNEYVQMYPIVNSNGITTPSGLIDTNGKAWTPGERFMDLNGNGMYDAFTEGTHEGWAQMLTTNGGDCIRDDILTETEFCDANGNGTFDYAEPYEDFLRIRNREAEEGEEKWVACIRPEPAAVDTETWDWCVEYITNNYPGDVDALLARIGNGQYDGPDSWEESGFTSKIVETGTYSSIVNGTPEPTTEGEHPNAIIDYATWWEQYWRDAHIDAGLPVPATTPDPPAWRTTIPTMAPVDPTTLDIPFEPNAGGIDSRSGAACYPEFDEDLDPNEYCLESSDTTYVPEPYFAGTGEYEGEGLIYPDASGMFDGVAEFQDLPSSIYHTRSWGISWSGYDHKYVDPITGKPGRWYGGDGRPGEVTSPIPAADGFIADFGQDLGDGDPDTSDPTDGAITSAGPFAYNVHGSNGYDAGNQLNLELLTWRYKAPTSPAMKRDFNLDGFMDLGEVREPGTENYARDWSNDYPSDQNDGGPGEHYPFNRQRIVEDIVEAMDSVTDWDTWITPCDDPSLEYSLDTDFDGTDDYTTTNKNFVFATFILPASQVPPSAAAGGRGMFQLPAPDMNLPIQIKEDPNSPISPLWFSDFGFAIGDTGESGVSTGDLGVQLLEHEFLHVWEGYPDLYDYDVYINGAVDVPVGLWDPMAGGPGHPSPPLKEKGVGSEVIPCMKHAPWIEVRDLKSELTPWGETDVVLEDYAFDPVNSAVKFENPNVFGGVTEGNVESLYFWRVTDTQPEDTFPNQVNFNKLLPGAGVLAMHTDVDANPEGIAEQQRVGDHQSYYMVQADGRYDMDGMVTGNGNTGDNGDPWPGAENKTTWYEDQGSPVSEWWDSSYTGLEILNIVEEQNKSTITFKWTPRLVPELDFIDPPGGTIVNGQYKLRYRASDFQGGTNMKFYFDTDDSGYDGTPINVGGTRKAIPAIIDGTQLVDIPGDATYWFYAKLTPGLGNDGTTELSFSPVTPKPSNTGHGVFIDPTSGNPGVAVDLDKSMVEYWTITCIDDETPGAEKWSVEGLIDEELFEEPKHAVTGEPFTSTNGEIQFTIEWDGFALSNPNAAVGVSNNTYLLTDPAGDFYNRGIEYGDTVRITDGPIPGFYTIIAIRNATTLRLRENPGSGAVASYRLLSFTDGGHNGAADTFTFFTTGKTAYSVPVTFQAGEVVEKIFPSIDVTYLSSPDTTPVQVLFDASDTRDEEWKTNETLEYTWDFGDGDTYSPADCLTDTGSRTCSFVTHEYTQSFATGAEVTLSVINPDSLVEGTDMVIIAVGATDTDLDTIPDSIDNCPSSPNTNQADSDQDGAGDICDLCPSDPLKVAPGPCGCGWVEFDTAPVCGKDCNNNGVQDTEDISTLASTDCNLNGIPDECDNPTDCDSNGVNDVCDIFLGGKNDCNNNLVPDLCESTEDCNGNGDMDICDLASGVSLDCNANDTPDECDIADGISEDTNVNNIPDECEEDCNTNGVPDNIELALGAAFDCNNNGVLDVCDIAEGTSTDCQPNGIPDRCDLETVGDCDGDLVPDDCSPFYDCNNNSVRDICDIVGTTSTDCDDDQIPDDCEIDTDDDGTIDDCDGCPEDPRKVSPGIAGCGFNETDSDSDGTPNVTDQCPQDPNKYVPGVCGCGVRDIDTESPADGVYDCVDVCAAGNDNLDEDDDGVPDACDECPSDPQKDEPGDCGCGVSDADTDGDGDADCNDNCRLIDNPNQADSDQDGAGDACDACPNDPEKVSPGECGCGAADVDTDRDNILDCNDNCPDIRNANQADGDEDGVGDACDGCPENPAKSDPGVCGCDALETDSDGDSVPDCIDECPATELGANVDTNGCVSGDQEPGQPVPDDADGDGVADEDDLCPNTPDGVTVNSNGCALEDDEPTPNACGADAAPCGATGMFGMWLTLCGLGWLKGSRVGRRR